LRHPPKLFRLGILGWATSTEAYPQAALLNEKCGPTCRHYEKLATAAIDGLMHVCNNRKVSYWYQMSRFLRSAINDENNSHLIRNHDDFVDYLRQQLEIAQSRQ
jgi:hypothetical protein